MSMTIRYPFRNLFGKTFDVDWEESWKQAIIPADGTIIVRRELVERKYMVVHEEDGTIKYVPVPINTAVEAPENYGGTE